MCVVRLSGTEQAAEEDLHDGLAANSILNPFHTYRILICSALD